jgi:acyl-CoA synthetase (AMP-forming)/AMP-acid ligase II/alpha-ketoglutarate-dependent taurine dioxygenase
MTGPSSRAPADAPADLAERVLELLAVAADQPVFLPTELRPDGAVDTVEPMTLAALYARASVLATRMAAWQEAGRRVALAVHIGKEAAALYLACQLAGIAPAMLPVPARPDEVAAFAAVVPPLAAAFAPDIVVFDRRTFELVHAAGLLDRWRGDLPARVMTEPELGELGERGDGPSTPRDPAWSRGSSPGAAAHYLFTSGTTGRSKVVRLSRGAVARNTRYVAERWGFGAGDRLPVVGPPYHSGGLMVGLVMPIYMAAAGVFATDPTSPAHPDCWLRFLGDTRCTHLVGGDGLLRTVLLGVAADAALRYPALRRIVIGGEPLDLGTYELVERHFAPRASDDLGIFTAYGMTEAAGLISTSSRTRPTRLWLSREVLDRGVVAPLPAPAPVDRDAVVAISCGSPSHGVELRIVDDAGRPVPDDVIGRIEFRSACLFDGYVSEPAEAAAAALAVSAASLCTGDRFFPSGDLGFLHAGELFVRGRLKEAIPVDAALVPAERVEAVARAACVAAAGHHGLAALDAGPSGSRELTMMQEVTLSVDDGADEGSDDGSDRTEAAARAASAIAHALFRELSLPSVHVLLFAPGALPRLCTSAKKVRIVAAAALARGELTPLFSRRFAAPADAVSGDAAGDVAWCATDVERDRRWLLPVGASEAAALERAVIARRTAADVVAPIRDPLDRALRETARGLGFAVIRGLPASLPVDDLERMVTAIGGRLGQLMPQNLAAQRLTHVQDRGGQHGARGYLSSDALALHSDTTDVLALFCVRGAATGGDTVLVSSLRIFRELAALDAREALAVLRAGFVYAYPDTPQASGGDLARRAAALERRRIPVFSERGGRISCRYLRAFIELAEQRHGRPLPDAERRALDLYDQIAARPELQLRLRLEPGDLLLVNNYSVLHARTGFADAGDEATRRLLLRLWIHVPELRPVIPVLRQLSERFVSHAGLDRPEIRDPHVSPLPLDRGGAATR